MDNARGMRGLERIGDLLRDGERFVERDRSPRQPLRKVLALDQLHHERTRRARILNPVDVRDVRMIQRRERLRLAFEAHDAIGIACDGRGKHLERDLALEPGIACAIDFAHAALAKLGDDFVDADAAPDRQGHERMGRYCSPRK